MKQGRVLVLGAGTDRAQRINSSPLCGPTFDDNFEEVVTVDHNMAVKPTRCFDLNHPAWPDEVQKQDFDEVHAYECLHMVGQPGSATSFFTLWKQIWLALKDGGLAYVTVPWWESKWIHQDPGIVRTYTPELLFYLNQRDYNKPAMTDYSELWYPPFSFVPRYTGMRGADPKNAGFTFVLQKERYVEGQD